MSLLGNLNGMDAVLETDLHVKMLLNRISPALSELFKPANSRIMETLTNLFPQSTKDWSTVKPLDKIVLCISRGITLAVFGPPACDDMLLNKTFVKHTQHVFTIGFAMRLVPWFLQPALVWCLPAKWHIRWTWETLRRFVYPEVERRLHEKAEAGRPNLDLISCMVQDAKRPQDANPELLAGLIGSIAAGATYSSAALIIGVISDLVAQPHFLEEIREEIRAKHAEVKGNWTSKTFDGLVKLDSAMKETLRLAPGALIIYSRKILGDITLSSGLKLQKGQYITVSGHSRAMDPDVFPNPQVYDALRSYNQNLGEHRARPFNNVLADDFRWGAGRWACPGRHIATQTSKAILVKLLDEYDFKFLDGKRPNNALLHEFVFFHPDTKMLVRRRESNCGIVFS
ncbi:MAG: hypothetical protein M1820_010731 [Bogoriella megaspora]|nr:MAG: hypothetical protein M1820_010731 [Bogoriella megaspora]